MAMLAEPRQKRRYHLTPKGKPLFEDTDRFGTKMLEKMGWSKGKGLGKSEDGTQDFVRVKYKSDERGLGFQVRDDQWTEHDKNFNGLLENLNGSASECPDDYEIITPTVGFGFASKSSDKKKLKDKISGQSLEEKSKKSKARVHYQKFTKGKDMSQYSEKDLANIFGKKATPDDDTNIYNQFQAFNAGGSDNSDEKEMEAEKTPPLKVLPPIINTGVSVSDYFKAKMAALKEKKGSDSANPFNSNIRIINNVEVFVPSVKKRKRSTDTEVSEADEEEKIVSKDKKMEVDQSDLVNKASVDTEEDNIPRKKKKSKKQSIDVEESNSVTKIEDSGVIFSNKVTEEEPSKKKSKKLSGLKDTQIAADETNLNHADSISEESISSKKKKKSKKVPEENIKNEENVEMSCTVAENEIPKKKKKKDKKKSADVNYSNEPEKQSSNQKHSIEESTTQTIEEPLKQVETIKSTKSKKKKNKTIESEVSSQQNDFTSLTNENEYLLDTYTISSFCAEKFRVLEIHQFKGSNLMDINGYGLSKNLELEIQEISTDSERIIRLWSGTLDKYTHSTSKQKIYSSYMHKVRVARKTKHKIPSLKFKGLKRQQVFQCL